MPIQWRKQMSVGNLIIDLDHRYLLCLINSVEYALRHPEEGENLHSALKHLAEYAREHFDREEKIQYHIKYQYFMDHKMKHQKLLDRLDVIIKEVIDERDLNKLKEKSPVIAVLLRDWLLDHVLKEDMKMKRDLESFPANLIG